MKMKMKSLILATTMVMSAGAANALEVAGGTVNFEGEFVNAPCAVSTDTANQTVQLGQYRTADLAAAGEYTTPVPFKIQLVNCDITSYQTAQVSFSGSRDATDSTLLAVNAGTAANATAATGVGIEISDAASNVLTPNGDIANASEAQRLINGDNTLNFTARYKSTAAVTAGKAHSTATFNMIYN
jgi:major type 1 subunit fimbrin (pilin)